MYRNLTSKGLSHHKDKKNKRTLIQEEYRIMILSNRILCLGGRVKQTI
jgi:hypothetical protein